MIPTHKHKWVALGTLLALISIGIPASAQDKEQLATEVERVAPVHWKDYDNLNHDFAACIAGIEPARLTHAVCRQLNQRRGRILWDALKQAARLNAASTPPRFCSPGVTQANNDQDAVKGGAIAANMIELQLQGGTGPYGGDLPAISIATIVYDDLVKIVPCKQ